MYMKLQDFEKEVLENIDKYSGTLDYVKDVSLKILKSNPKIRSNLLNKTMYNGSDYTTPYRYARKMKYLSKSQSSCGNALKNIFSFLVFGDFKVYISEEVSEIYNAKHLGFSSCMSGCGQFYEIFDMHKDVSVAYLAEEENSGEIFGRTLIWKGKYFDNVYCKDSLREHFYAKLAEMNLDPVRMWKDAKINLDIDIHDDLNPYMDTLRYYNMSTRTLHNGFGKGWDHTLQSTNGSTIELEEENSYEEDYYDYW